MTNDQRPTANDCSKIQSCDLRGFHQAWTTVGRASRAPDAATDPPPTLCGPVLVAVVVFDITDGSGRAAGRFPSLAHRTHLRPRAESWFALAGNATVQSSGHR